MPNAVRFFSVPLLVQLLAATVTSAASPNSPDDVIGTSIGTDLLLDTAFGSGGFTIMNFNDATGTWDQPVRALAAADGGTWIVGYHRPSDGGSDEFAIAKLRADGTADPTYGINGQQIASTRVTYISDAVLGDDGRFYVAGLYQATPTDVTQFGVACVETDATPCAGFGDGGGVVFPVAASGFSSGATYILYRDGALFAIGNTDPGGGNFGHSSGIAVAKLDAATGAPDPAFGNLGSDSPGESVFDLNLYPAGFDYANAAAFGEDGIGGFHVLVGGSAQTSDNQSSAAYVLAVDPATGALDESFGAAGVTYLPIHAGAHLDQVSTTALAARSDGRIIVAGNANHDDADFNITNDVLLAALNPDGSLAPDFTDGGLTHVNVGFNTETTALVLRADGDLVVTMQSNGLLPDAYEPFNLQSVIELDANGNGPIAAVSVEFPSDPSQSPLARPTAVRIDANDRVIVAGLRLWGYPDYPAPDFDFTATRFVRDRVFANGFDAP